jgi:hypothetical protein
MRRIIRKSSEDAIDRACRVEGFDEPGNGSRGNAETNKSTLKVGLEGCRTLRHQGKDA